MGMGPGMGMGMGGGMTPPQMMQGQHMGGGYGMQGQGQMGGGYGGAVQVCCFTTKNCFYQM
jgi:hypothetical protein